MPIDPNKLRESLAKAKSIINSQDFNRRSEINTHNDVYQKPRHRLNVNEQRSIPSSQRDVDDRELYHESTLEAGLSEFGAVRPSKPSYSLNDPISENAIKKSRLPKEILNSMVTNPVTFHGDDALFESLMPEAKDDLVERKQPEPIRQQVQQQQFYTPQPSIDYSLIKSLIDESIKRNLTEMKSSLLTEGTQNVLRMMRISNGNKVQVVDTKGNLYEGTLTLKKNILKK